MMENGNVQVQNDYRNAGNDFSNFLTVDQPTYTTLNTHQTAHHPQKFGKLRVKFLRVINFFFSGRIFKHFELFFW